MDLAKKYYDLDENEKNILEMVRDCPGWAANRVQVGERAIAELEKLKAETMTVEQAKEYLRSLGYYDFKDGLVSCDCPYVSMMQFKTANVGFRDYEFCLDGDFKVEELMALAVLLAAKDKGEF